MRSSPPYRIRWGRVILSGALMVGIVWVWGFALIHWQRVIHLWEVRNTLAAEKEARRAVLERLSARSAFRSGGTVPRYPGEDVVWFVEEEMPKELHPQKGVVASLWQWFRMRSERD